MGKRWFLARLDRAVSCPWGGFVISNRCSMQSRPLHPVFVWFVYLLTVGRSQLPALHSISKMHLSFIHIYPSLIHVYQSLSLMFQFLSSVPWQDFVYSKESGRYCALQSGRANPNVRRGFDPFLRMDWHLSDVHIPKFEPIPFHTTILSNFNILTYFNHLGT